MKIFGKDISSKQEFMKINKIAFKRKRISDLQEFKKIRILHNSLKI